MLPAPVAADLLLSRLLPLSWNVLPSFQEWSPLKGVTWAGLVHYEEMLLYDDVFWESLWNTVFFIGAAPIAIAAGAGHRAAGQRRPQGRDGLPHDRLPVLSADDGGGRHHLALDV